MEELLTREYQRSIGKQTMLIECPIHENETGEVKLNFREQMLIHNRIDGILTMQVKFPEGRKTYEYNISGMKTLTEYCRQKKLNREDLALLLKDVLAVIFKAREFMLLEEDFMLEPDSIFIDRLMKVGLAYYPGYGEKMHLQLRKLSEFLMDNVDYRDEKAVLSVYNFYMHTKEETCTAEELLHMLNENEEENPTVSGLQNREANYFRATPKNTQEFHVCEEEGRRSVRDAGRRETGDVGYQSSGNAGRRETGDAGYRLSGNADRRETVDAGYRSGGTAGHEAGITVTDEITEVFSDKHVIQSMDVTDNETAGIFGSIPSKTGKIAAEDSPESDREEYYEDEMNRSSWEGWEFAKKVIKESSLSLKLTSFAFAVIPVLLVVILSGTPILKNEMTGGLSLLRVALSGAVALIVTFFAERKLWASFAQELRFSLKTAAELSTEVTTLLYGGEETGYPISFVSEGCPTININHFPYYIGKDERRVDFVLNKTGISRYHLKVDKAGDDFTISDLNSTNGTFLNSEKMAPHMPYKIRRGDEIRLADCIFYCN